MNESRIEKNYDITEELEKERKSVQRKRVIRTTLWISIPSIIVILIGYFLIRVVGNMGLVVREYSVYKEKLPNDFEGLKIIQFSDLHYTRASSIKTVKTLVNLINKANPDIVIFTGDLIDSDYDIDNETLETIMSEFKNIKASIGKYAIKGEEDFENFSSVFNNSNFIILENTVEKIYYKKASIDLLILDDTYTKDSIKGYNDDSFTIAITHKPDLTDRIMSDFNVDLIFAGHSHNGQIILPLIGGIFRKSGAKKYPASHYKINNTDLYVSGGIGNRRYQFRLFNHPSINFYRLRTSK